MTVGVRGRFDLPVTNPLGNLKDIVFLTDEQGDMGMFKAMEGDWLQFCLCNDAMEVFVRLALVTSAKSRWLPWGSYSSAMYSLKHLKTIASSGIIILI